MDILAQIVSEKHENPIEFLNQLRQTTEPIGGGMEYCDNGEYVDYDVAIEAVKKEQKQLIEKACKYIKKNVCEHISHNPLYKDYKHEEKLGFQLVVDEQFYIDFKKAMEEEI